MKRLRTMSREPLAHGAAFHIPRGFGANLREPLAHGGRMRSRSRAVME